MRFTQFARTAAFGVVVLGLVALGAYLLYPAAHRPTRAGDRPRAAESSSSPAAPFGSSSRPPAGTATTAGPDIYQWLPFSQAGLGAAASVTVRFGDAYGTSSYAQSAAAYAARLRPLASAQLVGQIEAAYSAPGVASARTSSRQVSSARTVIDEIRAFGPTSLTFVVQVTQRVTDVRGSSLQTTSYAVTVTGDDTSWQVSDIEPAAAGNS